MDVSCAREESGGALARVAPPRGVVHAERDKAR